MKRFALALIVALVAAAGTASAQTSLTDDTFSADVNMPADWIEVENNDRAVFNFKHEESQSQIEVVATRLMTADVAADFFETFHETLRNSGFVADGEAAEVTHGDHTGSESVYSFTHTDISLKLPVFQFTDGTTAWIVVGYVQADTLDEYKSTFEGVVESLSLGE